MSVSRRLPSSRSAIRAAAAAIDSGWPSPATRNVWYFAASPALLLRNEIGGGGVDGGSFCAALTSADAMGDAVAVAK